MKQKAKEYLNLVLIAGAVIALDQWTKSLIRENIEFGIQWLPSGWEWLMPYARIVHWQNSGAAFGMFQSGGMVFTTLAFIVIAAIFYYYPHVEREDWTLRLAMGLQMGGAAGNLIDRLTQGTVTDFISVGRFPVFNLADASITIGVMVLLLGVWLTEREEKRRQLSEDSEQLSVNGNQLSVDSNQSSVDSNQSSVDSNQSSVDSNQSSVDSNQLSVNSNQLSADAEKEHDGAG